jgi:hypothetical protein
MGVTVSVIFVSEAQVRNWLFIRKSKIIDIKLGRLVWFMVFNDTFNNISVIWWRSIKNYIWLNVPPNRKSE